MLAARRQERKERVRTPPRLYPPPPPVSPSSRTRRHQQRFDVVGVEDPQQVVEGADEPAAAVRERPHQLVGLQEAFLCALHLGAWPQRKRGDALEADSRTADRRYLAQVAQQPGAGPGLAEAGHPVGVPGVAQQQLGRPQGEQDAEPGGERGQELAEAGPGESRLEGRHPAETEADRLRPR